MPRSPTSQDMKDSLKKAAKSKAGKNNEDSSPLPPEDPDERLIYDAYKNSTSQVHNIVNTCLFYFLSILIGIVE